jgi:hypothetical protein
MAPFYDALFFIVLGTLEGSNWSTTQTKLASEWPSAYLMDCTIWPVSQVCIHFSVAV